MIRIINKDADSLSDEQIKQAVIQLTIDRIIRPEGQRTIFDINRFELMYGDKTKGV